MNARALTYSHDWLRLVPCGQWVCVERHLFSDWNAAYRLVEPSNNGLVRGAAGLLAYQARA